MSNVVGNFPGWGREGDLGEPTYTLSFLVGCLNPCLQGTSVRVGLPQREKGKGIIGGALLGKLEGLVITLHLLKMMEEREQMVVVYNWVCIVFM